MGVGGDVRISAQGLPDGWTVKSITANDRDITDSAISLAGGQNLSVRIVVTDRLTHVNGTVSSRAAGRGGTVVIFPEDAAKWGYPSRFVRAARVNDAGAFEIAGLPPGERYLATALEFFEDGDEQDPEVLERLRANATPFTIGEGERMTLDLRARER
jgi:hypothetical protein